MFFYEAFGGDSLQFANALVDGAEHNPLGRYDLQEDYNAAIKCLRQHGLYKAYFGTNRAVAWTSTHAQQRD
jgi:hypothetical protein